MARGKPRNDKANREQLALNSGGLGGIEKGSAGRSSPQFQRTQKTQGTSRGTTLKTLFSDNVCLRMSNHVEYQPIASLTGFPTLLSISTSVSIVNLAVFLFTTSDTRGRDTIKISAASACFR